MSTDERTIAEAQPALSNVIDEWRRAGRPSEWPLDAARFWPFAQAARARIEYNPSDPSEMWVEMTDGDGRVARVVLLNKENA